MEAFKSAALDLLKAGVAGYVLEKSGLIASIMSPDGFKSYLMDGLELAVVRDAINIIDNESHIQKMQYMQFADLVGFNSLFSFLSVQFKFANSISDAIRNVPFFNSFQGEEREALVFAILNMVSNYIRNYMVAQNLEGVKYIITPITEISAALNILQ